MKAYSLVDIKVLDEPVSSLKEEAADFSETLVPNTKLRDILQKAGSEYRLEYLT
jgi:hypothetical protein